MTPVLCNWHLGTVRLDDGRTLGVILEDRDYYPWITDGLTGTRFKALVGWDTEEGARSAAERLAGLHSLTPAGRPWWRRALESIRVGPLWRF